MGTEQGEKTKQKMMELVSEAAGMMACRSCKLIGEKQKR